MPLELTFSPIQSETTEPLQPASPEVMEKPSQQFQISSIFTEETRPVEPQLLGGVVAQASLAQKEDVDDTEASSERPSTAVHVNGDQDHSIVGFKSVDAGTDPISLIDPPAYRTVEPIETQEKEAGAAPPVANNVLSQIVHSSVTPQAASPASYIPVATAEHAAQTILTATQIDKLLLERSSRPAVPSVGVDSDAKQMNHTSPVDGAPISPSTPRARALIIAQKDTPQTIVKRPGSSSSQRRGSTTTYPPLPSDHKQAIAAATQRLSSETPASGAMGPPLAPASAYRTTPKPDLALRMSKLQVSRMVLRPVPILDTVVKYHAAPRYPLSHPRMIQAITQTMIGEFLWKYTRRTGRSDVSSNNRHQRYFWVHPYTRTLYWSDQDPQAAGKLQHKAKSVAIEAVRVVNDDNPYPPGLHRKSLEIVTPGRTVKFTASTSQRHETWFNALSYLLLRTAGEEAAAAERGDNLNSEDINEFNPSYRSTSRLGATSRLSVASRTSRNVRTYSKQYPEPTLTVKRPVTPGRASPALSSGANSAARVDQVRHGSVSRLSTMFRNSAVSGTFSSRRSRYGNTRGSIDSTSALEERDSAEELRQVIEKQEMEANRLENVRACCDGKHDVSSLSRTSRYSTKTSPHKHG
ncbi:hypothetical protein ACJ72_06323 [Emergomyces africanus]|uniref:PH domain-containing protein n=1 Tax=Emergomyces africanus TaxID=1955775 RepID=A0A1B7NRT3_9EURO|nr:hypothetical protein ACJ72_06323 [Emergomyces africanus]